MKKDEMKKKWHSDSEEIISGIAEWREQHPTATLREIEAEVDQRLAELRVRMIADAALASKSAEWVKGEQAGKCPVCGQELEKKGKKKRVMQTRGGKEIELEREYGQCPRCGAKIFPPG
jgi:YgiT-type zinc finger domain-containing protein